MTSNLIVGDEEHHQNQHGYDSLRHFPSQLHVMLKYLESNGMTDIISWQPHGRALLVHNKEALVEEILPQ
jgi:HSF-type DNA-binding